MATYTSAATGLWSDGATWVGGVKPPSAAGHKIVIANTHVVTYDEASGEYGDDTTSGITINAGGTLKFSRSTNTELICYGGIVVSSGGTWDRGTIADPTPQSVVTILTQNKSAAMAAGKYGMDVQNGAICHEHGASKTCNTRLNGAFVTGVTSLIVLDATGWQPGDLLYLAPTTRNVGSAQYEIVTIHASYTPGSTTVPLVSATTKDHADTSPVSNLTNNVITRNSNDTYPGYVKHVWGINTALAGTRTLRYITFLNAGHAANGNTSFWGVNIATASYTYNTPAAWNDVEGCVFYTTNTISRGFSSHGNYGPVNVNNCCMINTGNQAAAFLGSGTYFVFTNCVLHCQSGGAVSTSYSEGSRGVVFNNCDISCGNNNQLASSTGMAMSLIGCRLFGYGSISSGAAMLSMKLINCDIGYTFPLFNHPTNDGPIFLGGANHVSQFQCTDCMFGSNIIPPLYSQSATDWDECNDVQYLRLLNKNLSAVTQELYVNSGYVTRDNSTYYRSPSSVCIRPMKANRTHSRAMPVSTLNGVAVRVVGYIRSNAAWGSTYPSVTLSGLGITPQTFTGTANDTWEKFDFTATQTSGADGNLTLTFSGASANANGNLAGANDCKAWISGCVDTEFVTQTRHCGFLFDGLTSRTVDTSVTDTEAAIAAYTEVNTVDKFKNRLDLWSADNQYANVFYSYAGSVLNLGSYALVVDATAASVFDITGTTITIKASTFAVGTVFNKVTTTGTVTKANGAVITALWQSATGPSAKLVITLPHAGMSVDVHNSGGQVQYLSGQSGTYTLIIDPGASGTWSWVVNKQGYGYGIGDFTPSTGGLFEYAPACPQVLTPDGNPMYQGTSSALVAVSYDTGFTYIDIGNGTPTLQSIYDEYEDYLVTSDGMDWVIAGYDGVTIFNSSGGDFLFMTGNIRLRRATAGDVNATVPAFAQSVDGTPVDEVNGTVRYLTSDSPTAIAAAVMGYVVETGKTMQDLQRLMAAVLIGRSSGAPANPVFRDVNNTKDRVWGAVDSNGNRTAVTVDAT